MARRVVLVMCCLVLLPPAWAQRQMEDLGRGTVAVRISSSEVLVSWRMLGTDPEDVVFNLYRSQGDGAAVKVNGSPLTVTTDYVDTPPSLSVSNSYHVRPVIDGVEQAPGAAFTLPGNQPLPRDHQNNIAPYLSVPLDVPAGGTTPGGSYTYAPNDAGVGDLDGDGELEIILKWDPSNSRDNAHSGHTGPVVLDAYELNGTRLWRIDLGRNIRAGAHYTQFMVYDLDGDGRAELACKTAPGTVDGLGNNVIMGSDDPDVVYTNSDGRILAGPEYLTVFDGLTGAELATTNYVVPRHPANPLNPSSSQLDAVWGDGYGNRVDRFLAGVAYLDGIRPSLVMCRGYYTRSTLAAWDWRDDQLTLRWLFDSADGTPGNAAYAGQGNHQLSVADVDADGKDEIIYGACSIDDDGTGLYTTGYHHGDALHVSDMDPDRSGIEVWDVHESGPTVARAGELRDARTGELIYGIPSSDDVGRGLAAHIDGRHVGYQMWSSRTSGTLDRFGAQVSGSRPSINFVVWWDDDLQRELLDNAGGDGANTSLEKWTGNGTTRILSPYSVNGYGGARNNNGTKSNPCLSGDILGDWREEFICRNVDNDELMIFVTPHPARHRMRTLLHDAQYRVALAWQNTAYNQPPHPSFYLGAGMSDPPPYPVSDADLTWVGDGAANTWDLGGVANWRSNGVWTGTTPMTFARDRKVLFDLGGSTRPAVALNGSLQPGDMKVHSPTDYTFGGTGSLTGPMALRKAGVGTLTLNNDNLYTGPTVVSEGLLLVNGRLSHSHVTVKRGVWHTSGLGGEGTLGQGAAVEAGCSVYPGNGPGSPGTLTVSNALAETGQVANQFDLSDDPDGPDNDRIRVVGGLTLAGVNAIYINPLAESRPHGTYTLIEFTGSFAGSLANIDVQPLDGYAFTLLEEPGRILLQVVDLEAVPPDAPAALTAFPGNARIELSWSASSGATGYRLKRSLTSGAGYITVAEPTGGEFVDLYVANGTPYRYVVTAVNGNGESAGSPEAEATPSQAVVYPGEDETYGGGAVFENSNGGFHDTGYVNFSPDVGSYLQFDNVDAGGGGTLTLRFRFALGNVARTGRIIVNGVASSVTFESTGTWTTWAEKDVVVALNAGTANTIRLESTGADLANIDELTVFGTAAPPPVASPLIDRVALEGSDLALHGLAGVPFGEYHVLSSTDLHVPAGAWVPVATNQFDANGVFNVTNALDPALNQSFFRVGVP